jgi:hypothetical protein
VGAEPGEDERDQRAHRLGSDAAAPDVPPEAVADRPLVVVRPADDRAAAADQVDRSERRRSYRWSPTADVAR